MAARRADDTADIDERVAAVVKALEIGEFDPQHAGPVYLREDAARAVREALGDGSEVVVTGDGGADPPGAGFLGMRVVPDLAAFRPGDAPRPTDQAPLDLFGGGAQRPRPLRTAGGVAVTLCVLRQDARPAQAAIADAVLLATRYEAVVVVILDRRLGGRDPFGGAGSAGGLSGSDRRLVDTLARDHGITIIVRRQDPFGFG